MNKMNTTEIEEHLDDILNECKSTQLDVNQIVHNVFEIKDHLLELDSDVISIIVDRFEKEETIKDKEYFLNELRKATEKLWKELE